jgi:glycosyltransferase involved in cell wall biosynthesis
MGENGYQRIIENFSLKKMGNSFIDIYNELQSN